jgi:hypothetical protein
VKTFTRKQHYIVLLCLLALVLLPRLPFQGPYLYNGDPVAYFSGAETILNEGKYLIDGKKPIWPVGTSASLAPLIYMANQFGWDAESMAFWHGIFFIFIAVASTYLLGKRLFNPATGVIAAILLAFAESPFIHSVNSASDPGALAMLVTSIYFMHLFLDTQSPKDLFLSFFLLGIAFVFRWNYAFFLPLFIIYLVGDRRIWAFHLYPSFWLLGAFGFFMGIFPQLYINTIQFGNPFQIGYSQLDYSEQFVFNVGVYLKNIFRVVYRILFTWDFFSPLLAMFGVLASISLWKEKRRDIFWLFSTWIVLGTLSVVYFGVKPRLLIPIMPPLFLIGAEGLVRTFTALRTTIVFKDYPRTLIITGFVLMAIVLFSPMFVRTLLHAHGHYEDKVTMQTAFRWAGENNMNPKAKIITQPYYAGQNADWLRAGWDVWASKRYSGKKIRSLAFPDTWKKETDNWVVINRFWFEGSNLRVEKSKEIISRFDSLRTARDMEKKAEFHGRGEPVLLKKLNILSYYPVDFLEYKPVFEIWGPKD